MSGRRDESGAGTGERLAADVVSVLGAAGQTLATAESLTAGLVGAALGAVPGASAVYRGGVISYALEVKSALLGVDPDLLARCGAVDPEVARQMADGARRACAADWAVSTTGVAGPEPHGGQPVGTVWIGVAGPDGALARELGLSGDRRQIRRASAEAALEMLLEEQRKSLRTR